MLDAYVLAVRSRPLSTPLCGKSRVPAFDASYQLLGHRGLIGCATLVLPACQCLTWAEAETRPPSLAQPLDGATIEEVTMEKGSIQALGERVDLIIIFSRRKGHGLTEKLFGPAPFCWN